MPTEYDYYCAALFAIEKMAEGRTPTKALDMARLPYAVYKRLITHDPALAALAEEAEIRGADAMADALLSLREADNPYNTTDPKEQKVISDNIKWLLSRRHNRVYGEKVEVKVEATVQHVIISQLEAARERSQFAALERAGEVIDADYVTLPPPPPMPPR